MIRHFLLLSFIALSATSSFAKEGSQNAKPASVRVPSSVVDENSFSFEVSNGERNVRFIVWKEASKYYYAMNSNELPSKQDELSETNYQYLMSLANGLKKDKGTSPNVCPRQYMALILGSDKKERSSCIRATNKTTKKMKELSDVLALLI